MITAHKCYEAVKSGQKLPLNLATTKTERVIISKVNDGWLGTGYDPELKEKRQLIEAGFSVPKEGGIYWLYAKS